MTKPVVVLRTVKGEALTYNELDQNFINLRDSTINFTGDAGDTRSMDLNDSTDFQGERNILVTVDEATQTIKIRNTLSDYTTDPNGFENRTDSTISFNQIDRVFTVAPVGAGYNIWNKGQQYYITTVKSVTIPDTNGVHLVYFDGSTLTYSTGAEPNWADDTPVSYVYWNSTTDIGVSTDERHGIRMDASTKEYLHETASLAYANGFQAANYTTLGDGTLDAHAYIDIGNGICYDQDLKVEITHSNTPTPFTWQQDLVGPARIPVVYHADTTGFWTIDAARDFPVKNGISRVTYNLNTAGVWSTPDVLNTEYVAYWIVATNLVSTPVIAIMGQRQDNKLSDAIANNTWSSLDLSLFLAEEYRPLYRVIVRTATAYTNTPKAYFAQVDDFRLSITAPAGSISAVNAFTTISVAGQTDITADTATDALTLVAGTGITLTTNSVADSVTITNSSPGGNSFSTIAVGATNVVADSTADTLTLLASGSVSIVANAGADSITISSSASGVVNAGASGALAFYPSPGGAIVDDTLISYSQSVGLQTLTATDALTLVANGAVNVNPAVNSNILLNTSGTGVVALSGARVLSAAEIQNGGNGVIIDSGSVGITSGTNADLYITPNGTGRLVVVGDVMMGDTTAGVTVMGNWNNASSFFSIKTRNASTTPELLLESANAYIKAGGAGTGGRAYIQAVDGDVHLQPKSSTGRIVVGAASGTGGSTITSFTTNDLTLNTNSGTNSGSIVITQGVDQNITIAPNGTGAVVIDGEVDINANIASTPVSTTTVVAWLEVGSNGSVYYLPLYQ